MNEYKYFLVIYEEIGSMTLDFVQWLSNVII